MRRLFFITSVVLVSVVKMNAQTDKAEADSLFYELLSTEQQMENWHPELIVPDSQLVETAESGIYIVRGDSFQVKSLRSDFYVLKKNGIWIPVNDKRYPMETMVNLLLNRIEINRHKLELRHHQYGKKIIPFQIPMQNLYDILARNTQIYCSVTNIDKHEIQAVLIFYQQKVNMIHLLELKMDTDNLFESQSTLYGELYTNIPQGNVKNLFKEKK